jgi:type III pantothenate kinase
MDLALDIGNTAAKFGLFADGHLLRQGYLANAAELCELVAQHQVKRVAAASVSATLPAFREALPERVSFLELTGTSPLPIKIKYQTPETLGPDRIAAVLGARHLFPGKDVLVMDAGTCITCELLTADGVYQGGCISPGLDMRYRAMHTFTAKLPQLNKPETFTSPGTLSDFADKLTATSTADAIQAGALDGFRLEIMGLQQAFRSRFPDLVTVICGGDAAYFESNLQAPTFAVPELVLLGLASLLIPQHA